MPKVLVVGGSEELVAKELAPQLSSAGAEVIAHWPWTGEAAKRATLPVGCEAVVVFQEMTSFTTRAAARALAERAKIPCAVIPRQWSVALPILRGLGIASGTAKVVAAEPKAAPAPAVAAPKPAPAAAPPKPAPAEEKLGRTLPDEKWAKHLPEPVLVRSAKAADEFVNALTKRGLWTTDSLIEVRAWIGGRREVEPTLVGEIRRWPGRAPLQVLLVVLRIVTSKEVRRTTLVSAYRAITGRSLGPYYDQAAAWLLNRELVLADPGETARIYHAKRKVGKEPEVVASKPPIARKPPVLTEPVRVPISPPFIPIPDVSTLETEIRALRAEVASLREAFNVSRDSDPSPRGLTMLDLMERGYTVTLAPPAA